MICVELAGVEPASKQGIQKPSPCADTEEFSRKATVGDPQGFSLVPYLRSVAERNRQHPDGMMSQSREIGRPSGGTAYC